MMKIGIVGCAGRMGRMLISTVLETAGVDLVGGIEQSKSEAIGSDLGYLASKSPIGLHVGDDPNSLFEASDTIIDFTTPVATETYARLAQKTGKALVVGTTGLGEDTLTALREAGNNAVVIQAGNMSLGINLIVGLVEQVAGILGKDYDIEIVEMHHKKKIDAPSGTALMLGEAAAKGRGIVGEKNSVMSRVGETGVRPDGAIGYATIRGGDVIGDHSTIFAGPGERIELTHKATDRALFAKGAVHAAIWARNKAPGVYSMRNVLGLE